MAKNTDKEKNAVVETEAKQEEAASPEGDKGTGPQTHTLTPLQATVELVKRGRREFLPRLREQLKPRPDVWQYVGDLARQTERAWVELIGGQDDLLKESLVLHAETMRHELAGPDPQPLERLIVERMIACQFQLLYLDALEAQNDFLKGGKAAEHLMRRQNQAHRQLMDAAKTLAIVRKLKPPSVIDAAPQPSVPAAEPNRQPKGSSDDESAAKLNGHNGHHHNRLNGFKFSAVDAS